MVLLVLAARGSGANAADLVWSAAPSPPTLDLSTISEEVHNASSTGSAVSGSAAAGATGVVAAGARRRAQTAPTISSVVQGCTDTECSLLFTSDQAGAAWCVATVAGDTVVTTTDATACVLTGTADFGVTPGSCADADSAVATCAYVAGTYSDADLDGTPDTEDTADSCTSTTTRAADHTDWGCEGPREDGLIVARNIFVGQSCGTSNQPACPDSPQPQDNCADSSTDPMSSNVLGGHELRCNEAAPGYFIYESWSVVFECVPQRCCEPWENNNACPQCSDWWNHPRKVDIDYSTRPITCTQEDENGVDQTITCPGVSQDRAGGGLSYMDTCDATCAGNGAGTASSCATSADTCSVAQPQHVGCTAAAAGHYLGPLSAANPDVACVCNKQPNCATETGTCSEDLPNTAEPGKVIGCSAAGRGAYLTGANNEIVESCCALGETPVQDADGNDEWYACKLCHPTPTAAKALAGGAIVGTGAGGAGGIPMTVDHHGANSCTITGLTSGDNYVPHIYTEDSAGTAMDQAAVTATAAAALAGTDTCQSQVACAVDTGACTTNYPAVLGCTDPINTWTYTYGIGDELVGVCTDQDSGDCATHADVCSTSTGYETVRACTALAAAGNSYVAMTGSANDIAVREPCNDFAAVSSVASCSACSTGTAIEDCTAGVCAAGYHTFVDGDATTTACSPCSEVLNAAAEATYTCTGDSDSDVSACLDVWMASGKIPQAPLQSALRALRLAMQPLLPPTHAPVLRTVMCLPVWMATGKTDAAR
jgi:hypothetical protein